jgi:signal transduction histidine kinase
LSVQAQTPGQIIVKLKNTQGQNKKFELVKKYLEQTEKNDNERKLRDIKRVLKYVQKQKDTLLINQLQLAEANVLTRLKDYKTAKLVLDNIIFPSINNTYTNKLKTYKYHYTGNIYYFQFDYKNALEQYYKAYEIANANDFVLESIKINNNISLILKEQQQENKALQHFKENLVFGKFINSKIIINKNKFNISETYLSINQLDSARYYAKQLIDSLDSEDNLLSSVYYTYAKASVGVLASDSLEYYLQKAISIESQNYLAYQLLASIKKKNDINEALKYYLLSLEYAKKQADFQFVKKVLFEIGNLYQAQNDYKKANYYLRRSKEISDSLIANKKFNSVTKAIAKFESEKKDEEITTQNNLLKESKRKLKQNRILITVTLGMMLIFIAFFIHYRGKIKYKHQIELINKANNERNVIANELHETVGERLTYIVSSIDNLLYNEDFDIDYYLSEIKKIKEFAADSIAMFRDTLWALHKSEVTQEEYISRTKLFFERIKAKAKHITFTRQVNISTDGKIPTRFALIIYKIVNEVVANIITQSDTTRVNIYFEKNQKQVLIKVKDFASKIKSEHKYKEGLNKAKSLVKKLNGELKLNINSEIEIIINIPIDAI